MKKYLIASVGVIALLAVVLWWYFVKIDFVVESSTAWYLGTCVYIDKEGHQPGEPHESTGVFGPKIGTKIKFPSAKVVEDWYKGDCPLALFREKPVPGVAYVWKGDKEGYVRAWTPF